MRSDRKRQVKTTRAKYGESHYKIIGKIGGMKSPNKFTSETGKLNAQKRWEKKKQKEQDGQHL